MKSQIALIGLGIVGVVVAIWAALRRSTPTVVLQASPSLNPMVTPLGSPGVTSSPDFISSNVQTQAPSAAASGVPAYAATDVTGGGTIAAPQPATNTPSFYGPIRDFISSMIPNPVQDMTPKPDKSGCGCGGGCGQTCTSKCSSSNSRFPDGRGGCLAFNRKTQINAMTTQMPHLFATALRNIESSDVSMMDIFQQTQFDNMKARGETPASPFLSPV